MKNLSILSAIILFNLLIIGCNPDPISPPGNEYGIYCEDLNNGSISMTIDGKEWRSNCLVTVNAGVTDTAFSYKYFYILAYDFGNGIYADSDIEMFILTYSESTTDGETTVETAAGFYDGFYDYSRAANDPDYEVEGQSFNSDEDEKREVMLSNFSLDKAKGTFNFDLFEEDSNEKISARGSFDVKFEN